jgi:hypothetical protein
MVQRRVWSVAADRGRGFMDGWESFALAQVGAAAALAGLVLVAVSVNLKRVLAAP